jgi:hypothetical protein
MTEKKDGKKFFFFMGKGRSAKGASTFFAISVKQSLTEPFFFSEEGRRDKVASPFFAKKKGPSFIFTHFLS